MSPKHANPRAALLGAALAIATAQGAAAVDLRSRVLENEFAYVPSQCYTMTRDETGRVHNPCYACHVRPQRPNYVNDGYLQQIYDFRDGAETNPWSNLFVDRSAAVAAVPDREILDYIRQDNYRDAEGRPILATKLSPPPADWDYDGDGRWSGYLPDCHFTFDEDGFDRAPDGGYSGWRAFAYHPFPGTFWPANGSTDDVLIRLDEMFRSDRRGKPDIEVYKLNLAIVEAVVRKRDVVIPPTDEKRFRVDLDKDGKLAIAEKVVYDWAPLERRRMYYVGLAGRRQKAGRVHLAGGLFPEGTEFLHSVRYIDVDDAGGIRLAPRMKELRYARKYAWESYFELETDALEERKEKKDFPARPRFVRGDPERGVVAGGGWIYQGFIEDAAGDLRPQTFEESVFCVGCHGGIGATTDGVFAFPRKLDHTAHKGGWYHWSEKGVAGLPEPRRRDGRHEFAFYLETAGAGDEFRANREIIERFFDSDGRLRADRVARLRADISILLHPSPERALALNKAYREIVREQSFIHGRDATITPPRYVHRETDSDEETGVTEIVSAP